MIVIHAVAAVAMQPVKKKIGGIAGAGRFKLGHMCVRHGARGMSDGMVHCVIRRMVRCHMRAMPQGRRENEHGKRGANKRNLADIRGYPAQ